MAITGTSGGSLSLLFATIAENYMYSNSGRGGYAGGGGDGSYYPYDPGDGLPGEAGIYGVYGQGGGLIIHSGPITMTNSILFDNYADEGPSCMGSLTSGDYNLVDYLDDCVVTWQSHDVMVPLEEYAIVLENLADNGGLTYTHAIPADSLALDKIPAGINGCGTTTTIDQRGIKRPFNSACEIGAFELGSSVYLPMIIRP
jgi:hypothetical protein